MSRKSFTLVVRRSDRIYLVDASEEVVNLFQNSIKEKWNGPLQEFVAQPKYGQAYKFKFKGNPFTPDHIFTPSSESQLNVINFFTHFLQRLASINYHLVLSSSKTKKTEDARYPSQIYSVWFFEQLEDSEKPLTTELICVSSAFNDRLLLCNGNAKLQNAIEESIEPWIQKVELKDDKDAAYKIKGKPWHSNDFNETIKATKILGDVIKNFGKAGYVLKYQGNIRNTMQCFYFIKDLDKADRVSRFEFRYLTLNDEDKIRLIDFPEDEALRGKIRDLVFSGWKKGVKENEEKCSFSLHPGLEYKLSGWPWRSDDDKESYESRQLLLNLLDLLASHGWNTYRAIDFIPYMEPKSFIILHRSGETQTKHADIQFWGNDILRVIKGPREMQDITQRATENNWRQGIESVGVIGEREGMKLTGSPWKGNKSDMLFSGRLQMNILDALTDNGFPVVASLELAPQCETLKAPYDRQNWIVTYDDPDSFAASAFGTAPPRYEDVI